MVFVWINDSFVLYDCLTSNSKYSAFLRACLTLFGLNCVISENNGSYSNLNPSNHRRNANKLWVLDVARWKSKIQSDGVLDSTFTLAYMWIKGLYILYLHLSESCYSVQVNRTDITLTVVIIMTTRVFVFRVSFRLLKGNICSSSNKFGSDRA